MLSRLDLLVLIRLSIFLLFLLFLFLLLFLVFFLLFVLLLFRLVLVELTFCLLDGLPAPVDDAVLVARRRGACDGMRADDGTVLVELYTPWERAWTLRRRKRAAGGDVSLLVVRVLF